MHRRTGADLLPLDTKLEKTLRNLKKEKAIAKASSMVETEDNGGFLDADHQRRILSYETATHRGKQL